MGTGVLLWWLAALPSARRGDRAEDPQNNRQVALAAVMYGGDFDDTIPLSINGRWSRLQDRHDFELTVNCPGPGTQDLPSPDAAGAKPTRTWVELQMPYIRSRYLLVCPDRGDRYGYFAGSPQSASDLTYEPQKATYRNQGRYPMYGLNYMFLAPIRIPKPLLHKRDAINYAEGVGKTFAGASDPENTIFFVSSQHASSEPNRGFFVVNAPGMWPKFSDNKEGYIAFTSGDPRGGDWSRESPDSHWEGFVYTGYNKGSNASFLDGHVKYMRAIAMAAGTSYAAAKPGSSGSGAVIVDKKSYLWDYDGSFYGL